MPGRHESIRRLPSADWGRLEQILHDFEDAWAEGRRPALEAYLPDGPAPGPLLVELVHLELELRLKAGEPARVETYLERYPELATDPETAVTLVAAEYELRRRREPGLTFDEYRQRFPQLASQFETALAPPPPPGAAGASSATTVHDDRPAPEGAGGAWAMSQGRYRPRHFHARGGLGEVFVADDHELRREVALKRLQERFADDAESRRRFLREAHITSRLGHPGIVPVHGLVQDDQGRPCYAMRFIEGTSLQDAVAAFHRADRGRRDPAERSLALRELLGRFVAVCNTIAYAHSRGVVHCDLKPGNIMLGKYGETLVIDWGLARPFARGGDEPAGGEAPLLPPAGDGDGETRIGETRGTPAFMSPEQAAGRWDVVGPASDVYSLGATLYCLLTGEVPFRGADHVEVLRRARQGEPPSPRQVKPGTPAALDAICRKAMAPRPEERYATALELAGDVTSWLADEKVRAHREPLAARLARWRRRHRAAVAAAAVAGVFLIAGGLGGSFLWQSAEHRRHEYLADLAGSGEGSEKLALEELRAGRFARAEEILRPAAHHLDGEPALADLRARLAARLDRAHRLAEFYRLADEAERREAVQSTRADNYAESGAVGLCEDGLRQLGVFERDDWWNHLPDDDLQPEQRGELREDVFHQLLLLGVVRAKRGAPVFGKPEGRDAFRSALDAFVVANRFRPDSYMGSRMEAVALFATGQTDKIKPFAAQEPGGATDEYFLGLSFLGVAIVFDPANGRPPFEQFLVRQIASLVGIDVQDPTEKAVLHFRKAADLRPKHYWAHCWLGLCLQQAGKADAAELAYDTCVALRPEYVTGYLLRGSAILQQWSLATDPRVKARLFERALADYGQAIRLDPKDARGYGKRGIAYREKGDTDRALADFTEALRLDPKDVEILGSRGLAYSRKGDYDRAFADFAEAIRLAPDDVLAYSGRGNAYSARGDYDRAIADYTEALRRAPKVAWLYKNRGFAHFKKGDRDRAIADCTESLRLDRGDADAYLTRGLVYAAKGDPGRAIADYTEALRLDPKLAAAYGNRASAYAAKGEAARARADLEKAGKIDPSLVSFDARGTALARQGLWAEAAAAFGDLTATEPDNPAGWYHLAIARLGGGDLPAYRRVCGTMRERFGGTKDPYVASTLLDACLTGPDAVEADEGLARLAEVAAPWFKGNERLAGAVAYRRGRYEEAVRHFDEAGKVFALRPWDWLFLAMAHHRLSHADEARRFFDKAVAWMEEADKPGARPGAGPAPRWGDWYERVEVRSLRREAEAVLGEAGPKDRE
jgi:tetratricopeptide (TPR) repeat protein/tRNA A-37 threonylcarbamoyl transferase component Bud32